ncbi:MAG: BatD family protein [Ginsengibacter sp.]
MILNLRTVFNVYKKHLGLAIGLLSSVATFAQVSFKAVCSNANISKNEYTQVQFVIENAAKVDQIVPPSFEKFQVISGPNQQSSVTNINGAIKQYVAIQYVLKPKAPGSFRLGAALARIDGKLVKSNTLSITVLNSISGNTPGIGLSLPNVNSTVRAKQFDDYILRKGENLSEKIKKNLFVKVEVNKIACYVGEPIIASYKLYTRLKSESNLTRSPSFNGFSVSELDLQDNAVLTTEKVNGKEYSVYTLRKVQLYPLQSGNVELEPVEVENRITFLKGEYADQAKGDIFFDILKDFADANSPRDAVVEQKISLQSAPVNITVKPLPGNEPENFKGAVGQFTMMAAVQKNKLSTDESANLQIAIRGMGNLPMINAPEVHWPKGMEAFEASSNEKVNKQAVPLTGQKVFTVPFTADKQGTYQIPGIAFTFFDPASQTFKTLTTSPIIVDVKKGNAIKKIIKPFIKKPNETTVFSNPNFWILVSAIIVTGLSLVFIKRRKDSKDIKLADYKNKIPVIGNDLIAKHPLADAEEAIDDNDPQKFYYKLNRCLKKYLGDKFNVSLHELGKKKITELLDKNNVSVATGVMLTSVLEETELNLYAPVSTQHEMQRTFAKASEVVALLDKQVINR